VRGSRLAIVGLSVAVGAALVILLVTSRGSSSARTGGETAGEPTPGQPAASARGEAPDRERPRPRLGGQERETGAEGDGPPVLEYREYVRADGTVVRDHRKNAPAPDLETALRTPRKLAKVKPEAILAARDVIRPKVLACAASHPELGGPDSRVQAQLAVFIESGTMTVKEVRIQGDLAGTAVAECVQGAVEGLAVPAPGHDDVNHHMLTFPFRLPAK
jgi:hypothetical protein